MNSCRDVPVKMFENRTKFRGLEIVIQVDEWVLLRGSRKNNKGQLRLADLSALLIFKKWGHNTQVRANRNISQVLNLYFIQKSLT